MSQILGPAPPLPTVKPPDPPVKAAGGARYRLVRAFGGTALIFVGLCLVAFPSSYFMQYGPAWSLGGLIGQMLLGACFFAKGLLLYEQASFPPGLQTLQDPVACWMQTKLQDLKRRSWILWFLAVTVLICSPALLAVSLPFILLRPVYLSLTKGASLQEEGKKTLHYLVAVGKGLLFLTLCSCMAMGAGTVVIVAALFKLWHH